MQATREWNGMFEMLKERTHQPTILYPVELFFKRERDIRSFSNTKTEGIHHQQTCPAKIIKEVLQAERK